MIKHLLFRLAAAAVTAFSMSSGVAQANPATPMSVIESSAAQLCAALDRQPTDGGVVDGMQALDDRGLDGMDGALVMITAIHHVCPQREDLLMGVMDSVAADEICGEPGRVS